MGSAMDSRPLAVMLPIHAKDKQFALELRWNSSHGPGNRMFPPISWICGCHDAVRRIGIRVRV
jgi:hypothetical protein